MQDVVLEVLATVDEQYDTLDDEDEESELQHSTDNDTTEELPLNPLISSDEDVNNLHSSLLYPATTTDLHSRFSDSELYSDGKINSLDIVEARQDHKPNNGEGEHLYEESKTLTRMPNISSIHMDKEQALKDIFFEDVHSEVTEQDETRKLMAGC